METMQATLNGEIIEYNLDVVERTTKVLTAKYFKVSVSESGADELDRMHEKGQHSKLRSWIASHMRPHQNLSPEREGELFQKDLELFCKIL